jgi:cell wall-associated NlpC family hydrolase
MIRSIKKVRKYELRTINIRPGLSNSDKPYPNHKNRKQTRWTKRLHQHPNPRSKKFKEKHKGVKMGDIEKMLTFATSKWHKVGYSMGIDRLGPDKLDCSSFVFYALIAGGFLEKNSYIGNTEDLYRLKGKIFEEIYDYNKIKRGDIFIRGYQGISHGAKGHTGIFTRKGEIIHCNATNKTVTINNEASYIYYFLDCKRSPYERYFRPIKNKNIKRPLGVKKIKNEKWKGKCLANVYVREKPTTSSRAVALYKKGDTIHYDSVYEGSGYRWISYIGKSGKRRYVAYRDMKGNQWIKF